MEPNTDKNVAKTSGTMNPSLRVFRTEAPWPFASQASGWTNKAILHDGTLYGAAFVGFRNVHVTLNTFVPYTLSKAFDKLKTRCSPTSLSFDNLTSILHAAGLSKNSVISCTVFFVDLQRDIEQFKEEYAKYFQEHKPALNLVDQRELDFGPSVSVFIDFTAAAGDTPDH